MAKIMSFFVLFLSISHFSIAQNLIKVNSPINVNVAANEAIDDTFKSFSVTWTAEQNIRGYEIFLQIEESRTISFICNPAISHVSTSDIYGAIIDNAALERRKLIPNDRRWRIGVRCKGKINNNTRTSNPSDIVWSAYTSINLPIQ